MLLGLAIRKEGMSTSVELRRRILPCEHARDVLDKTGRKNGKQIRQHPAISPYRFPCRIPFLRENHNPFYFLFSLTMYWIHCARKSNSFEVRIPLYPTLHQYILCKYHLPSTTRKNDFHEKIFPGTFCKTCYMFFLISPYFK